MLGGGSSLLFHLYLLEQSVPFAFIRFHISKLSKSPTCIQSTLLVELGLKSFEMIVIPRLCDLHILHQIGTWLTIDNKLLPRDKMKEIYLKVS